MPLVKMLLAIDVLKTFMIGVENKLLVGKIIAPMLDGLHYGIELQVISRVSLAPFHFSLKNAMALALKLQQFPLPKHHSQVQKSCQNRVEPK
jgi:hypothetical protein